MSLNYFGTDGIRGKALESPLRLEDASRWGAAWAQAARAEGVERLVVGWDPRLSSEPLFHAFRQGVGMRLEVLRLGLAPTPAVAWTVARLSAAGPKTWGLMISASHNPPEDNGLKGFNELGEKLEEDQEGAIEDAFDVLQEPTTILVEDHPASLAPYLDHLGGIDLPASFPVVIDCAHGATAPFAAGLIRGAAASLGIPADGARINMGVGSTHLGTLQAEVRARGAALGIAFDGDGDRCLLVDPSGEVVDGDQILWLLVLDRLARGEAVPGVVGTLMTNAGFEAALASRGVPFVRTPVGDKFMLRELAKRGWDLAAEASGHVIQKHLGPSGDGLATALDVLRALLRREPSQRWSWRFQPWPLRLENLVARERRPLEACVLLADAQADLQKRHGDAIRVVVRWSGTEPKLRLMVEARTTELVDQALTELDAAARGDLGLA
jgi:phosphoglucosamine mutase